VRPGDREQVLTVAETVRDAAAICDPGGSDWAVTALLESYEDDDRPATAVEDFPAELVSTAFGVDPEGDSPAAAMAAAVAAWLATNPGDGRADDRERVLREAARLRYHEHFPEHVSEWLHAEGAHP
jgi:hypothetical protein